MNKKFKFLKKNLSLLDLGSYPGGWSQVANKEIIGGKLLAVDIKPMEKINNVDFIKGDFRESATYEKIMFQKYKKLKGLHKFQFLVVRKLLNFSVSKFFLKNKWVFYLPLK